MSASEQCVEFTGKWISEESKLARRTIKSGKFTTLPVNDGKLIRQCCTAVTVIGADVGSEDLPATLPDARFMSSKQRCRRRKVGTAPQANKISQNMASLIGNLHRTREILVTFVGPTAARALRRPQESKFGRPKNQSFHLPYHILAYHYHSPNNQKTTIYREFTGKLRSL